MLRLEKFKESDVYTLAPIMKEAFDEDSFIHLGTTGGPDGYDDGSFLRKWFLHKNATAFCVYDDDELIGGVNLWIKNSNVNYLGCMFIAKKYENCGIGAKVWKMVEETFPETKIWRTETPIFSHRNHNFYINKCGFKCVQIENPKSIDEGQFKLEKIMTTN